MRHRVGVLVAPRRQIRAEQLGVGPLAFDLGHVVVLQREPHRRFEIALEGEIDVAAVEHQRAVDAVRLRKAHHDAARPMRERAGLFGPAPDADGRRAGPCRHRDCCRRATSRVMRFAPRSSFAAARTRASSASSGAMRSSASGCSLEITWMRAPALRIAGVSGACIRPSMVQSTTKPAAPSALDHRRKPADRLARAGRAHRHRMPVARRRHHDVERLRAEPQQRQLRELHVELARLRLGEDRRRVAALHRAALEHLGEGVDPLSLDAVGEHLTSPNSLGMSYRVMATNRYCAGGSGSGTLLLIGFTCRR